MGSSQLFDPIHGTFWEKLVRLESEEEEQKLSILYQRIYHVLIAGSSYLEGPSKMTPPVLAGGHAVVVVPI